MLPRLLCAHSRSRARPARLGSHPLDRITSRIDRVTYLAESPFERMAFGRELSPGYNPTPEHLCRQALALRRSRSLADRPGKNELVSPPRRLQAGSRQTLAQALVAITVAGASYAWAMGLVPPAVPRQLAAPEAMLVRAMLDIGESRFSSALEQINNLLASNPNFRLAQLVRETWLIARSRPINRTATHPALRPTRSTVLRQESARGWRVTRIETPRELAPLYLLQCPEQKVRAGTRLGQIERCLCFENTWRGALRGRLLRDHRQERDESCGGASARRSAFITWSASCQGKTHRFLRQRAHSRSTIRTSGTACAAVTATASGCMEHRATLTVGAACQRRLHRAFQCRSGGTRPHTAIGHPVCDCRCARVGQAGEVEALRTDIC